MELGEVGDRVHVRELLGVEPLGELLEHHEVIGRVEIGTVAISEDRPPKPGMTTTKVWSSGVQ